MDIDKIGGGIIAIITGVIGLAIVSVIFSARANTANVLQAGGGALASVIGAAVSPVSGGGGSTFSVPNVFTPPNLSPFGSQ